MSSPLSTLTSLMGLQLFTRLFTFILNQALFRMASPKAYGVAAIQFELMLSTILFLSREGVRGALLRVKFGEKKEGENDAPSTSSPSMNVAFVPIFIGVPLAILTSLLYISTASTETSLQSHFASAVAVYGVAAVMELLAEPMHNMSMVSLQTNVRVRAEGVGITLKTLTTFVVLLYDANRGRGKSQDKGGDLALLAFALGQLVYGSTVFLVYLKHFGREGIIPRMEPVSRNTKGMKEQEKSQRSSSAWHFLPFPLDQETLALSMTLSSQSLIKHFLTEGDKLILSWFSPLQDQGGYALAVNYGSLIARIVFQPIEETLRLFFSKTLADVTTESESDYPTTAPTATTVTASEAPSTAPKKRVPISSSKSLPASSSLGTSSPSASNRSRALTSASSSLTTLLRTQISLSLIFVAFASQYISLFLHLILPAQYLSTSAPKVLSAWVYYIPFLAINGGLEAFVSSVVKRKEVGSMSRWMFLFTMIYISSALALYTLPQKLPPHILASINGGNGRGLGDSALVYANIINLSARIGYALWFIRGFFARHAGNARSVPGPDGVDSGAGVSVDGKEAKSPFPPALSLKRTLPAPSLLLLLVLSLFAIRTSEGVWGATDLVRREGRGAILWHFNPKSKYPDAPAPHAWHPGTGTVTGIGKVDAMLQILTGPVIMHVSLGVVLGLGCLAWWAWTEFGSVGMRSWRRGLAREGKTKTKNVAKAKAD